MNLTEPPVIDDLPPIPGFPWATAVTALLILFFFFGLVVVVMKITNEVVQTPDGGSAEKRLEELRAQQKDILNNYGYDAGSKAWRIPIDQSMSVLAEEGKAKGELQSFPTKQPPAKMKQ